jgi:hypothetical protein
MYIVCIHTYIGAFMYVWSILHKHNCIQHYGCIILVWMYDDVYKCIMWWACYIIPCYLEMIHNIMNYDSSWNGINNIMNYDSSWNGILNITFAL